MANHILNDKLDRLLIINNQYSNLDYFFDGFKNRALDLSNHEQTSNLFKFNICENKFENFFILLFIDKSIKFKFSSWLDEKSDDLLGNITISLLCNETNEIVKEIGNFIFDIQGHFVNFHLVEKFNNANIKHPHLMNYIIFHYLSESLKK